MAGSTRSAQDALASRWTASQPLALTRVSGTVNVSVANVRSGGSTSYRIVKSLPRGTKITETLTSNAG